MNSLVGYGVSSDSESDGEGDNRSKDTDKGVDHGEDGTTQNRPSRNYLLESGSASSESSSESDTEEVNAEQPLTEVSCPESERFRVESTSAESFSSDSHKLPPPPLGGSGLGGVLAGNSVFANPFKERAEERLSVLQKHVPLTLQARPSQIGGKRMCVAYRKDGRCRFGIRCKFAHDSDLQGTAAAASPGNAVSSDAGQDPAGQDSGVDSTHEEERPEGGMGKKRRVGLSDTLTPPKRALKQYSAQREKEKVTPY